MSSLQLYETSDDAVDSKEETIELTFEFSFYDASTNDYQELGDEQCLTILQAVQEYVPTVIAYTTSFPFLQFEYYPDLPESARLPVKVAGCYTTYVHSDKLYPWGSGFIGQRGRGDPVSVSGDIPQHRPYTIPSLETITSLASHLPLTATNISSFPRQLVVEMTSMPEDEFNTVLRILPHKFDTMLIGYCNGSYLRHKASQCVEPTPRVLSKSVCDKTNYLKAEFGETLRPGTAAYCPGTGVEGECWSNFGIAVFKDGVRRITVAHHTYDKSVDKSVYHTPDCRVGVLTDCLGEDIGLVDTQVAFSNTLFDGQTVAKRLARGVELQFGDECIMDSFVTGKQILSAVGLRFGLRSGREGPLPNRRYLVVDQGIHSIMAEVLPKQPYVRDGTCGTPLIKEDGSVISFMCWNDVPGYGASLYCFTQPVDPLIDAGWSI
jgi:hypothetical protein